MLGKWITAMNHESLAKIWRCRQEGEEVIKHNAAESYSVDSSMAISKNWNKKCYVKENWRVDYMSSDKMQSLGTC